MLFFVIGSVIGQQQHFLESVSDKLLSDHLCARESSVSSNGYDSSNSLETSQISSTTSTEITDDKGITTVLELSVVETRTTAVPVPLAGDQTASLDTEPTGPSQGDELNLRKAQRSREKASDRQTRSMCRQPPVEGTQVNQVKKKRTKKRKQKTR